MTIKTISLTLYLIFCAICLGVVIDLTVPAQNGESLHAAWFYSILPALPISYLMEVYGVLGDWDIIVKTIFYSTFGYVFYFLFCFKLYSMLFKKK